tara:strand:- start:1638 stop:4370 length:2733 start_codon:yes stop_codon:yes gene_type:complete
MSSNYGFEPTLDGLNNIDADSSTVTDIICDTIQINLSGTAPTVTALSNDTSIATTAWVNNHTDAILNSNNVWTGTNDFQQISTNNYDSSETCNIFVNNHPITFAVTNASNFAYTIAYPLTLTVPPKNTTSSVYVSVPFCVRGYNDTPDNVPITLTYVSVTTYILKNGLVYSGTNTATPYYGGATTKTWTPSATDNYTCTAYFGHVAFYVDLILANTGTDVYSVGITIGANHSDISNPTTMYILYENASGFTQTHSSSPSITFSSTDTVPFVTSEIVHVNQTEINTTNALYVTSADTVSLVSSAGDLQNQAYGSINYSTTTGGIYMTANNNIGFGALTSEMTFGAYGISSSIIFSVTYNNAMIMTPTTITNYFPTTFITIPSCSVAPTTANHLCNKTYTDGVGSILLPLNNVWTGTNAFPTINSPSTLTDLDIAVSQVSGILNIGTANSRTSAINIGTGSIRTGIINIGTGNPTGGGTNVINLGSTNGGTTSINCGTINLQGTVNTRLGLNMTSGTISVGGATTSSAIINIGTGTSQTGAINIASNATGNAPVNIGCVNSSTQKLTFHSQDFKINTGFLPINNVGSLTIGGANIYLNSTDTTCNGNFNVYNIIGSSGANLAISTTGTDDITITSAGDTIVYSPNLIMSSNTALIFAGTTSGTGIQYTNPLANEFEIQLLNVADTLSYVDNTGGSIFYVRANEFNSDVPTRFTNNVRINTGQTFTLGSPATIDYPTTTSYSETSPATVLTYVGGTFRSIVTWTNWATSTGFYIFNRTTAVAGWTNGGTQGSGSGGYFSCPPGVYTYYFSIIFEDGTAYSITDFKGALVDINTITAGSSDATIIAGTMGNNFTCFRHQVSTISPSSNDVPAELMSGTFRITTATNLYVWFRINNSASGGINNVYFDLSIIRIA